MRKVAYFSVSLAGELCICWGATVQPIPPPGEAPPTAAALGCVSSGRMRVVMLDGQVGLMEGKYSLVFLCFLIFFGKKHEII